MPNFINIDLLAKEFIGNKQAFNQLKYIYITYSPTTCQWNDTIKTLFGVKQVYMPSFVKIGLLADESRGNNSIQPN